MQVWEIILLAFGLGLVNAFDIPSRQAMTLDMVGREDLRHAIALNSMMFNLARVIGPSLAGALIAIVGEGICFALNAASFGAVLTSLILMRIPQRPPRVNEHALREIADGYRYSFGNRRIRVALMLVAVSSCFGAAYLSLLPAFARDQLHGDATSYGTLMTSIGIGALMGAYGLSRIHERWLTLAPIAASLCFGAGLIAFSHSHVLWVSVLLLLPTAFSLMMLGGTTNTIIQLAATEHMRGRVISHYTQSLPRHDAVGIAAARLHRRAASVSPTPSPSVAASVIVAAAIAWFNRGGEARAQTAAAE